MLLAVALPVAVGAETWQQHQWTSTLYYRSIFTVEESVAGSLYVAGVDEYEAYLNGTPVAADSVWSRMRGAAVAVGAGENHLALRLTNHGTGAGNGLVLGLIAGGRVVAQTTTDRSVQRWYWTHDLPAGGNWLTDAIEPDNGWDIAQTGRLDSAAIVGLQDPDWEVIAGFHGAVDLGTVAGGIVLRDVRGENVALGRASSHPQVTDGSMFTSWDLPLEAEGLDWMVDLGRSRVVHTVRVLTRGSSDEEFQGNSLLAYAVEVGDGRERWEELRRIKDISQYEATELHFAPVRTRFVRVVVVEVDGVRQPRVAEIEVYGEHFTERGTYISPALDLGLPDVPKNFGTVAYDADVPRQADVSVRFRTGDGPDNFVDPDVGWSDPLPSREADFPGAEPGRWLQYRVDMVTQEDTTSAVFRGLSVAYDTADIPVSRARAWVNPTQAVLGSDTTFAYYLQLEFSPGDRGVERIHIDVPGRARVAGIRGLGGIEIREWISTQSEIRITLDEPLMEDTVLQIDLSTRLFLALHQFESRLYAPGSEQPVNAGQSAEADPTTGTTASWSVTAMAAQSGVLSRVRALPNLFTPNGDGINDDTVIEFVMAKGSASREVRVRIFDLAGRQVRDLEIGALEAGAYLRASGDTPGRWDGTSSSGTLVPPGVYLYRLEVNVDTGREVAAGFVGVAY